MYVSCALVGTNRWKRNFVKDAFIYHFENNNSVIEVKLLFMYRIQIFFPVLYPVYCFLNILPNILSRKYHLVLSLDMFPIKQLECYWSKYLESMYVIK